jgi:hypothetical protein
MSSYYEAVTQRVKPAAGVLLSILQGYQASEDFRQLAERTRADYVAKIKQIERQFGDFPLGALTDRRTSDKRPWTSDGFRASWGKAAHRAGIIGVTFNDLRGTAVTRLALAECTEAEIATITGHSLRDVRSILDANYLHRDPALGESAIRKLETRTKSPN